MDLEHLTEHEARSIFVRDLKLSLILEGMKVGGLYICAVAAGRAVGEGDFNRAALLGIGAVACAGSNLYRSILIWRDYRDFRYSPLDYVKKYERDLADEI